MISITSGNFHKVLVKEFPHSPTSLQDVTLQKLADFVFSKEKEALFLLKGYAGTGKTTIIGSVVKNLWHAKMKAVLLAPTGRAAKVMSVYAKTKAFTIHKKIYFPKKEAKSISLVVSSLKT